MTEIKTLRNYAYWWLLVALLSVMFAVLLGWYRRHIHSTDGKLRDRTEPLENITSTLLASSGSSDDSLIRSTIAERESAISGLDLTPSINRELRHYISNLYTVAWAFDAAKDALPQTNDREYLFNRWTIELLHTNSLLSGDVLALYSWRQTIRDSIIYLSWAVSSTGNPKKKTRSQHNLSVALASQIGVEVLICTKSYDTLAESRRTINALFSGLQASYTRQIGLIDSLTGNNTEIMQCLSEYRWDLTQKLRQLRDTMPTVTKLSALASSRQRAYSSDPLQCPIWLDLYNDITQTRSYQTDLEGIAFENTALENIIATGSMSDIQSICTDSASGSDEMTLEDLLSAFTWAQQLMQPPATGQNNTTWSYIELPDDTQKIINDVYQNNINYIDTMQASLQSQDYQPVNRIKQLFMEFYGDLSQFIR